MDVRTYPNSRRPGVGLKPRRESHRPFLPQHARHCPVLEAGSALGFLVYPPLEPNESFHLEFQGEGRYQFTYFMSSPSGRWDQIFTLTVALPLGSIGMLKEEVAFPTKNAPVSREEASRIARAFIVPEDLGTPPGALSLRAATNFQTPPGWDTVYTPVFNMIERPVAPMLSRILRTDSSRVLTPASTCSRQQISRNSGIRLRSMCCTRASATRICGHRAPSASSTSSPPSQASPPTKRVIL